MDQTRKYIPCFLLCRQQNQSMLQICQSNLFILKNQKPPRGRKIYIKEMTSKTQLFRIYLVLVSTFACLWQMFLYFSINSHRTYIKQLIDGKKKPKEVINFSIPRTKSSEECPNESEVHNCCCPLTCDDAQLDQQIANFQKSGLPFTYRRRINYFISRYGKLQRSTCVETAREYPVCGNGCNPNNFPSF